jgi:type IV secretory pathway ATPase VirB11/archaellum biosynthesis ATPase
MGMGTLGSSLSIAYDNHAAKSSEGNTSYHAAVTRQEVYQEDTQSNQAVHEARVSKHAKAANRFVQNVNRIQIYTTQQNTARLKPALPPPSQAGQSSFSIMLHTTNHLINDCES